jgi:hypothetical protein
MPNSAITDERPDIAHAQYLVSTYLVRACQQAIYDLALDEDREPAVRHEAIAALREILEDWTATRRALLQEIRAGIQR